ASIPIGMDKRKPIEAVRLTRNDRCDLAVCDGIVRVKGSEQHGAIDSGASGPSDVITERCGGVPPPRGPIASSRVTVAVDDHTASRLRVAVAESVATAFTARSISGDVWLAVKTNVMRGAEVSRLRVTRADTACRRSISAKSRGSCPTGAAIDCTGNSPGPVP